MTENRDFRHIQSGALYGAHLKNVGHIRALWGTLRFCSSAYLVTASAPDFHIAPRSAPLKTRRKLRITAVMGHLGHFFIKNDRKVK